MTSKMATILGLRVTKANVWLSGITQMVCKVLGTTCCTIKSRVNAFSACLEVLVLQKLTGNVPDTKIVAQEPTHIPSSIELADPEFGKPRPVDMIIGAELFYELLCIGQIKPLNQAVTLQKTMFGWVLSGRIQEERASQSVQMSMVTTVEEEDIDTLSRQLRKFWELEESERTKRAYTREEAECEAHFERTCSREATGQYCLEYPLKPDINTLGNTRQMAEKRFRSLENRFEKNPELKRQYMDFLREYCELGHMRIQSEEEQQQPEDTRVFLPHHAVLRADSTTTKFRVVFDASAASTNGKSLNDAMMVGPTVQETLGSILLRFRAHKIAMTADIEKMYRQIKVEPIHCKLQNILWRDGYEQQFKVYELQTVTYGTAAAPYMATRTFNRLAADEKENYPLAAEAIADFYVDDWLSGARSISEAEAL